MSSTDALNSPLNYEIKNPVYSIKRSWLVARREYDVSFKCVLDSNVS